MRRVDGDENLYGHRSVAVPGSVAGLTLALERYGSMDLGTVLAPAIRLAREGIVADWYLALTAAKFQEELSAFPEAARTYLRDGRWVYRPPGMEPGDRIRFPDLARSLELIARDGAAADVGCGTGASAAALRALGFHPLIGIDPSSYAIGLARKGDGDTPFVVARAEALPLKTGSSGCVLCMDVLEHMADDVAALGELGRVVRPGSTLLLTVPAYGWAWSDHDVTLGHHRRYTARTLRRRVRAAGFIVRRCTYFHSWLVPLAFLVRKTPLARLMRGSAEEASFVSPGVNRLLHLVSRAERGVIRMVRLPFGLSIMLVAERPASQKAPE